MKLRYLIFMLIVLPLSRSQAQAVGFKKEYKMQVNVGPATYWGMGAARFAELAGEKTGGRIKVKPYYGSQLLKGAQLNSTQMVAMGAVDLAFESTINTAPVVKEMNVFSLPFFVSTFENVDKLESGETGRLLFQAMEKKGVQPLAWGENGFRQITNRVHPIASPGDLRGLKIRVVGSPIFIDIFRELGADPINMNWGDAITAFQQGTVDGQENPVAILLSVQINQYQQELTLWDYLIDPLILYWNKEEWDAFPDDVKNALREAAREAVRFQKALVRAGLDGDVSLNILKNELDYVPRITDPVEHLRKGGMKITILTEAQKKAFKEATRPVLEGWIEKIGDLVYQAALADMGEIKVEQVPKAGKAAEARSKEEGL